MTDVALEMTEDGMIDALVSLKGAEIIQIFVDYGVEDIKELYEYFFGIRTICDCSYELQCAVYDNDSKTYEEYVDVHYINKMIDYRWDRNFSFLPDKAFNFFFGKYLGRS